MASLESWDKVVQEVLILEHTAPIVAFVEVVVGGGILGEVEPRGVAGLADRHGLSLRLQE